jgi:hypothetical protein
METFSTPKASLMAICPLHQRKMCSRGIYSSPAKRKPRLWLSAMLSLLCLLPVLFKTANDLN